MFTNNHKIKTAIMVTIAVNTIVMGSDFSYNQEDSPSKKAKLETNGFDNASSKDLAVSISRLQEISKNLEEFQPNSTLFPPKEVSIGGTKYSKVVSTIFRESDKNSKRIFSLLAESEARMQDSDKNKFFIADLSRISNTEHKIFETAYAELQNDCKVVLKKFKGLSQENQSLQSERDSLSVQLQEYKNLYEHTKNQLDIYNSNDDNCSVNSDVSRSSRSSVNSNMSSRSLKNITYNRGGSRSSITSNVERPFVIFKYNNQQSIPLQLKDLFSDANHYNLLSLQYIEQTSARCGKNSFKIENTPNEILYFYDAKSAFSIEKTNGYLASKFVKQAADFSNKSNTCIVGYSDAESRVEEFYKKIEKKFDKNIAVNIEDVFSKCMGFVNKNIELLPLTDYAAPVFMSSGAYITSEELTIHQRQENTAGNESLYKNKKYQIDVQDLSIFKKIDKNKKYQVSVYDKYQNTSFTYLRFQMPSGVQIVFGLGSLDELAKIYPKEEYSYTTPLPKLNAIQEDDEQNEA